MRKIILHIIFAFIFAVTLLIIFAKSIAKHLIYIINILDSYGYNTSGLKAYYVTGRPTSQSVMFVVGSALSFIVVSIFISIVLFLLVEIIFSNKHTRNYKKYIRKNYAVKVRWGKILKTFFYLVFIVTSIYLMGIILKIFGLVRGSIGWLDVGYEKGDVVGGILFSLRIALWYVFAYLMQIFIYKIIEKIVIRIFGFIENKRGWK